MEARIPFVCGFVQVKKKSKWMVYFQSDFGKRKLQENEKYENRRAYS